MKPYSEAQNARGISGGNYPAGENLGDAACPESTAISVQLIGAIYAFIALHSISTWEFNGVNIHCYHPSSENTSRLNADR